MLLRRLVQLYVGLTLYGVSMALFVRSDLGVMPWDVLHQGLSRHVGLSIGTWTIIVGAVVLLGWIPLRERPGVGTVSNVLVIGVVLDAVLRLLPDVDHLAVRAALVVAGLVLNAIATAMYIGARLGPGPRDGLMTGLVRRTGGSVRLVRTGIEVVVVLAGWALGGTLGVATAAYALGIGPLVQVFLPLLTVPEGPPLPADVPDTLAA
ncbi:membrane protein [Angustibacter peucedani]